MLFSCIEGKLLGDSNMSIDVFVLGSIYLSARGSVLADADRNTYQHWTLFILNLDRI